jgi:hypothetical protein
MARLQREADREETCLGTRGSARRLGTGRAEPALVHQQPVRAMLMRRKSVNGIVLIVQEGRFQLRDDAGVGHQFELSHTAALEADQLPSLMREQTRVRVHYEPGENVIGFVARAIELLDT